MDTNLIAFGMTLIGTVCWVVCFWWMHRISSKQNDLLEKLCEQNKRIEKLSKVEHDLIKEVHPQVSEIKEGMQEIIASAKENQQDNLNEIKEGMQEIIASAKENQQDNQPHPAHGKPKDKTVA